MPWIGTLGKVDRDTLLLNVFNRSAFVSTTLRNCLPRKKNSTPKDNSPRSLNCWPVHCRFKLLNWTFAKLKLGKFHYLLLRRCYIQYSIADASLCHFFTELILKFHWGNTVLYKLVCLLHYMSLFSYVINERRKCHLMGWPQAMPLVCFIFCLSSGVVGCKKKWNIICGKLYLVTVVKVVRVFYFLYFIHGGLKRQSHYLTPTCFS
jgi:hypothetical protein